MTELISPENGRVLDLFTDIQNGFISCINSIGTEKALEWLLKVKNDTERTYPEEVKFQWKSDDEVFRFELSKSKTFEESVIVNTNESFCSIGNLENGTEYFWRINGSAPFTFTTEAKTPRFVKIDGLLNVRDIGGNKIKQGLIYRGSEISDRFQITEVGRKVFCNDLKIKTDLDLRYRPTEFGPTSPLGEEVTLRCIKYRPYDEVFEDEYIENIKLIMELFSDEKNYPIYMHCMGGADRTGMIALYLRSIAGEDDDTIHLDYELTGLSTYALGADEGADGFRSRNAPYYKEFIDKLEKYAPNGTLAEKAKGFLLSCGVTEECINKIYEIITLK